MWIVKQQNKHDFSTWTYACKRCGKQPLRGIDGKVVLSDYCPHCGKFMNEQKEKEK